MKEFPSVLASKNKDNFEKLNYDRIKCYMRRDIYEHVISHKESEYFSIDEFVSKRAIGVEMVKQMLNELIVELESIGWKCKKSFGGTGLFIYSTENPPSNCWEDTETLC